MIEVDAQDFADQAPYQRETRVIRETEAYELKEEILNGVLFMHFDMFEVTPSVYREMKSEWEDVKKEAADVGWEHIFTYSQNHSFCKKWGGVRVGTVSMQGEEYGVYVWELKS